MWIQPNMINAAFQTVCDFATSGGGWTLLLTSATNTLWTASNILSRNPTAPSTTSDFSILNQADLIKGATAFASNTKMEYRMDGYAFGSYGGVFSAPSSYSFVSTVNTQTTVSCTETYGPSPIPWAFNNDGIEQRMPWIPAVSSGSLLTTSGFFF